MAKIKANVNNPLSLFFFSNYSEFILINIYSYIPANCVATAAGYSDPGPTPLAADYMAHLQTDSKPTHVQPQRMSANFCPGLGGNQLIRQPFPKDVHVPRSVNFSSGLQKKKISNVF